MKNTILGCFLLFLTSFGAVSADSGHPEFGSSEFVPWYKELSATERVYFNAEHAPQWVPLYEPFTDRPPETFPIGTYSCGPWYVKVPAYAPWMEDAWNQVFDALSDKRGEEAVEMVTTMYTYLFQNFPEEIRDDERIRTEIAIKDLVKKCNLNKSLGL